MNTSRPHTIAIVRYPGAQEAAIHGLADMFRSASELYAASGAPAGRLLAEHCSAGEGAPPAPTGPFSALVIPPSLDLGGPSGRPAPSLTAWITERHREGTLLCSVCAGAFVLAETGLLDGRPATTHWALRDAFAARYPDVVVDTDKLIIDDGDIITAGGVMAWLDLGLRLVGRFLGPAMMQTTARYFLVDPGDREQRFYSTFAPTLSHGDEAILKAQHWLQTQSRGDVSVAAMARKAGLGERTFLRRFQKATGLKPTEYVQHLRVGKAREMLELTKQNVDEIARQVGYEDTSAFRRVFQRTVGLSPRAYRQRFAPG